MGSRWRVGAGIRLSASHSLPHILRSGSVRVEVFRDKFSPSELPHTWYLWRWWIHRCHSRRPASPAGAKGWTLPGHPPSSSVCGDTWKVNVRWPALPTSFHSTAVST